MTRRYDSWEEREKAEMKMVIKQKIQENTLSFEELTKKNDELEKEYGELEDRLEEIKYEIIENEYARILILMNEGLDD